MKTHNLSDYSLKIHDVGYFVFVDFIDNNTLEIKRISTNKEELKKVADLINVYLSEDEVQ